MALLLRMPWLLLRALARLLLLSLYIPAVYAATRLAGPLPRWRGQEARIAFARRYYFLTAVIAFGARLRVEGPGEAAMQRCLYVCNHVSWMDILVLYSVLPIRFISKSEVAAWPFFGHFARWAGTIFLQRGQGGRQVIASAAEALKDCSVVLFAEGTSTDGRQVRRFLPPAFRAAKMAGVPVAPVTIHYHCRGFNPSGIGVAYFGDDSLLQSVMRAVLLDGVDVHIRVHPAIDSEPAAPDHLARLAHGAVADGLAAMRARNGPIQKIRRDGG